MSKTQEKTVIKTADAVTGSWVYRNAPRAWQPYLKLARLDRPVGAWLLLWPCWWAVALAAPEGGVPNIELLGLFMIGAFVMRGAGCTYNDIIDRDFDNQVERTKSRPLPAGEVTLTQAWLFLGLQCLIGLTVLLQMNGFAQIVGVSSLILVALYPFMKRITYWPQAWLGLTFNWGALLGFAAVLGDVPPAAIALYVGGFFWTLGYDTVYAHQDKEDDALIGVKSTALALGDKTHAFMVVFYGLFLIGLGLAGMLAKAGIIYYISLVFAALHLIWQIKRLDTRDSAACLLVFRSNISFGTIIFIGIILDKFFA